MVQASSDDGDGKRRPWSAPGRLSLRARLSLLVVACVVPLLAFSLGSQYLQYRDAVTATGRQTLELVRSMAIVVEQDLQARMVALEVLALSPTLLRDDFTVFRAEAEAVIEQQFPGSNLIILKQDGQQLMNTLLPAGAPLPVRPNMEATRRVFASGKPAVSDFYIGAIGPRPVVAIDVPVKRRDGSVAYVLSSNPRLEDFAEIIRRQRLPESWIVSIFDRRGVNVARTPSPERFIGQAAGPGLLPRLLAEREGVLESTSREGIELVSAFSHSMRFGWAVAVGVPRVEMVAPALAAAARTLGVGAALLAAGLGLALLIARQITRPIAALRRLAAMDDGDAVLAAPSTGLPEADDVVAALRAAEQHRRRSEHDEEQARAALHESEEKLRQSQKMEAVGQLTGGLAHDFNNLLLVIIGNLDQLIESTKDPLVQEPARQALEAAQRGADLTRSLLAFARRQPLRPQGVAINDLVTRIARLLARMLGERIEVSLELAPDIWTVVADPAQLEAALTNLATNARDAMPRGGRLTIVTANRQLDDDYVLRHPEVTAGNYAMIEVSDTGIGMSPEIAAQIFDPFFTTKARGEGTGLGLSMVFGFVRQSGGHINVYSEQGVGTTFRIYLPRDGHQVEHADPAVAATSEAGGGETILVVEDNTALRRMVVLQLTALGYRVREAENAAAALAKLESGEPIDLLFADVVMPGKLDGYELARIVRERWPSRRVVLTSGFPGLSTDRGAARDIPLLSKPYRRNDLARVLRQALDGAPGAA